MRVFGVRNEDGHRYVGEDDRSLGEETAGTTEERGMLRVVFVFSGDVFGPELTCLRRGDR